MSRISPKLNTWLPLLFALMVIIGMFLGFKLRDGIPYKGFFKIDKPTNLDEVHNIIKNHYGGDTVGLGSTDEFAATITKDIDAYSYFVNPNYTAKPKTEADVYTFGLYTTILDSGLLVHHVIPNSVAWLRGIRVGDVLFSTKYTNPISFQRSLLIDNIAQVKKATGITVKLDKQFVTDTPAITTAIVQDTGVITIKHFSGNLYKQFMTAATALKNQNIKQIKLDISDADGFNYEDAIDIADEFLENNLLITYTVGTNSKKQEWRSRRLGIFENYKLSVVANSNTQGPAEVLLAALADWQRISATPETSHIAVKQESFTLQSGWVMQLTTAYYYAPKGRKISP